MPRGKRGTRKFTPAVSAEKNNQAVEELISDVVDGVVPDTIELGYVNKSLGDGRWQVIFYSQKIGADKKQTVIENTIQAIKSGHLSKKGAYIGIGSVVVMENIGCGEKPLYQIIGVFNKDFIREFDKIYQTSYENVRKKLMNGEVFDSKNRAYRLFWVDQRIFDAGKSIAEDVGGIEFDYQDDEEESNSEEEKKKVEEKVKYKKKDVVRKFVGAGDDSGGEVDIDNI